MKHVTQAWQHRAVESLGMVANKLLEIEFATGRHYTRLVSALHAHHRRIRLPYHNKFDLCVVRNQYTRFVREIMLLHDEKVHQRTRKEDHHV